MFRSTELRETLERGGWTVQTLSASNCLSTGWVDLLGDVEDDGPTWAHLIETEITACREPGCVDLGTHMIAVCGKPSP